MSKVKSVCSLVGALGGGVLMTGTVFAFVSVASAGAVAFAVGTISCGKVGSMIGNVIENNPAAISIANAVYDSGKLPKEYIDMEEY